MTRTRWTAEQSEEFAVWHERVMVENAYGADVVKELRRARVKFLASVAPKPEVPGPAVSAPKHPNANERTP